MLLTLLRQAKLKEKVEAAGGRLRSGSTGIGSSKLHPSLSSCFCIMPTFQN